MTTVVPHCPHCQLAIGPAMDWPFVASAQRCPHCRLIIGPGRAAKGGVDGDGDQRSRGSAAGILANSARREGAEPLEEDEIRAGLVKVAAQVGCAVDRLRLLDYQQAVEADPDLPRLEGIFATYPTWKTARADAAAAAVDRGEPVAD